MKKNIKTIICESIIIVLSVLAFVFTERTIRNSYCFGCTWRIKTAYEFLFFFFSYIVFAVSVVSSIFFLKKYIIDSSTHNLLSVVKRNSVVICYCLINFAYLTSTIINNGSYSRFWDSFIFSLPPFLLLSLVLKNKSIWEKFIRIIALFFLVLNSVNLLFVFVPQLWNFTPDFSQEYYLGFHTIITFTLVLGLFFVLLCDKDWMKALYIVLFLGNAIAVRQGVIFVAGMILALWCIPPIRKIYNKVNILFVIGITCIASVGLILSLEKITGFPPIKNFLWDVLHKDVSLSGRMYLWDEGIRMFKLKPVFGYGVQNTFNIVQDTSHWWNYLGPVHAHNLYVQTLLEGGIVTLFIGLMMIIIEGIRVERNPGKTDNAYKIVLLIALVILQADLDAYYPWYFIAFICHINRLASEILNEQ